jgi:hypothetical protein
MSVTTLVLIKIDVWHDIADKPSIGSTIHPSIHSQHLEGQPTALILRIFKPSVRIQASKATKQSPPVMICRSFH